MKFEITTKRLEGKYKKGEVIEANEGSELYRIMTALVEQGEAKEKKTVLKTKTKK